MNELDTALASTLATHTAHLDAPGPQQVGNFIWDRYHSRFTACAGLNSNMVRLIGLKEEAA